LNIKNENKTLNKLNKLENLSVKNDTEDNYSNIDGYSRKLPSQKLSKIEKKMKKNDLIPLTQRVSPLALTPIIAPIISNGDVEGDQKLITVIDEGNDDIIIPIPLIPITSTPITPSPLNLTQFSGHGTDKVDILRNQDGPLLPQTEGNQVPPALPDDSVTQLSTVLPIQKGIDGIGGSEKKDATDNDDASCIIKLKSTTSDKNDTVTERRKKHKIAHLILAERRKKIRESNKTNNTPNIQNKKSTNFYKKKIEKIEKQNIVSTQELEIQSTLRDCMIYEDNHGDTSPDFTSYPVFEPGSPGLFGSEFEFEKLRPGSQLDNYDNDYKGAYFSLLMPYWL
jgi:hypothetical protein